MDCGGVADKWQETVIKLWNPGDKPNREHRAISKLLAIFLDSTQPVLNLLGRYSGRGRDTLGR